jgi:CDP-glucose 4,6-dehydratase
VIRSDGTYIRDYIYVRDAARAYMQLAERVHEDGVRGEVFNFGLESPLTVIELVEAIKRLMDRRGVEPVIEARAVGEIPAQYLSAKKAQERLGWRPEYGLDAGLSETIDWYRVFLG